MTQLLTPNFKREEFEHEAVMPEECVSSYTNLAEIMEKIRTHFGQHLIITSGYRTPSENESAHGVKNSQHIATADWAAADWFIVKYALNMRPVFDFIRTDITLVDWDQCILEHGTHTDIIHLSWSTTPRREALEGATNNESFYTKWPTEPLAISA